MKHSSNALHWVLTETGLLVTELGGAKQQHHATVHSLFDGEKSESGAGKVV